MPKLKPLTADQQIALARVREARIALEVARKNRAAEIDRRLADTRARIAAEVNDAIALLDATLDDAMIDAVDKGVSIRRIALEGFGTPHDNSVRRMIQEAMQDDRGETVVISRESVSGNSPWSMAVPDASPSAPEPPVAADTSLIPDPIDFDDAPASFVIKPPQFSLDRAEFVLYEDENERIAVPTVRVEIDPLDPWVATMEGLGRKGSTTLRETSCTIYRHPATKKMVAVESPESGSTFYDHLAARWVLTHQDIASEAYDDVLIESGLASA